MSLIFLLLSPALFGIYLIIRFQICAARRRSLIDTYCIDARKLRKLSCKEVRKLKDRIEELRDKDDVYALESLLRPYRA